ncbi:MAG: metalloprotease [Sphingobacteriales bacterium]|nr:MAG: metalloprotease [Sphingobacteriales bacterium]
MDLKNIGESSNVEDTRGTSGGGGGRVLFGGGLGATVLALIVYFLGGDPSQVLPQGDSSSGTASERGAPGQRADDGTAQFVKKVLATTETVWDQLFMEKYRQQYQKPVLRIFDDGVQTECGSASAASGPFYCPADRKVYIDLAFAEELKGRFNAPGDFALAYVVAHEVGHHVQNLLGISEKVQRMMQQGSQEDANALSVRLELQADFLAGIWAHYTQQMKGVIEPGDIQEALGAAAAVGDDNIQEMTQGSVHPESFTHGSSEQRMYWFKRGYQSGDIDQGDTFSGSL